MKFLVFHGIKPAFLAILFIAVQVYSIRALACFSDENWLRLHTTAPRAALVYVWSPRMVLSAQHASTAQAAAAAQGLAFVAVHDNGVDAPEIADTLHRLTQHADANIRVSSLALQASVALCSPALLQRDALRHFPTAFVAWPDAHGTPVQPGWPIVGAMPAFAWTISLRQRMELP